MNTLLQQNSTHVARRNGDLIDICIKALVFEDMSFPEEHLYSIPAKNEDDLLAIFERLDENNRINLAEANQEFAAY